MRNSWKITFSLAVAVTAATAPAWAQTAPAGWTTQARDGGARTFTPPDLRVGESYSVTLYDMAALKGKTLEAYLRAFAGTVGSKTGQLIAPLKIGVNQAQSVSATGIYAGPNGTQLTAAFNAFSLDGGRNVSVSRVLTSGDAVFFRYKSSYEALLQTLIERARNQAGDSSASVPPAVAQKLGRVGGALLPGIYAGDQMDGDKLERRFRLYLYPDGKYHFKSERDADFRDSQGQLMGRGTHVYNPATGELTFGLEFDLLNDPFYKAYCYYGQDASGKPAILGYLYAGFAPIRTSLVRVGPIPAPPKLSAAQKREIVARNQKVADAAARNGFKWVTAPGKGVQKAQIQAVVQNYSWTTEDVNDEAYLLLKDGTIHNGLSVAPDQLDVAASRRNEPKAWGKWRKDGSGYQVSWAGQKWEKLPGQTVIPGAAGLRLEGRYATVRATMYTHQFWGVTFDKAGRFSKDQRGGATTGNLPIEGGLTPRVDSTWDDGGSGTMVSGGIGGASVAGRSANGDRQGSYSLNGYTLTLRYDNGAVVRLPFFFRDAKRKQLWFEGDTLELGLDG